MIDLFKELSDLLQKLDEEKIEYALCGGLAMAVYTFPRATVDIDILIDPMTLEAVKQVAKDFGYSFDVGLLAFKRITIYRMTKIPEGSEFPVVLDLLLVTPSIQAIWNDRRRLTWDLGKISVVSARGLMELKQMRNSGQDQLDIENLRTLTDED